MPGLGSRVSHLAVYSGSLNFFVGPDTEDVATEPCAGFAAVVVSEQMIVPKP